MNKETLNALLAILSIGILLLPVGVAGYMESAVETNILTVQASYTTGENYGLYDDISNVTELFEASNSAISNDPIGWDLNNDTAFLGYKSSGIQSLRDNVYYGNYHTYVGAGVHSTVIDWTDIPYATYTSIRYIFTPLNITCEELANKDFLRVSSDIDKTDGAEVRIYYDNQYGTMDQLNPTAVDADTDIISLSTGVKNILNQNPNGTVYIVFVAISDNFVETQTTFDWEIEGFELEPEDHIFGAEWTDTAIWVLIIMALNTIYIVAVIFANPAIDFKWDR